jgi:hypothetical protein
MPGDASIFVLSSKPGALLMSDIFGPDFSLSS